MGARGTLSQEEKAETAWSMGQAKNIQQRMARDRVAFLMHRAPGPSNPDEGLLRLEEASPFNAELMTTTGAFPHVQNHAEAERKELMWEKRRDRMTDYFESKLMLGNIGF